MDSPDGVRPSLPAEPGEGGRKPRNRGLQGRRRGERAAVVVRLDRERCVSLLDETTRSADVVARTDMTLLRLDRDGFDAFARYTDAIGQAAASRR